MSEIDKLAQSGGVKLANEIPADSFTGVIKNYRLGRDKYGRNVLKLYVEYNGETYLIALSPAYIREFATTAKLKGFKTLDELIGTTWHFEKKKLNIKDGQFEAQPRFIPVKRICTDAEIRQLLGSVQAVTIDFADRLSQHCDNVLSWLNSNCDVKQTKVGTVWVCK